MRGQAQSGSRKLNKHWQSGGDLGLNSPQYHQMFSAPGVYNWMWCYKDGNNVVCICSSGNRDQAAYIRNGYTKPVNAKIIKNVDSVPKVFYVSYTIDSVPNEIQGATLYGSQPDVYVLADESIIGGDITVELVGERDYRTGSAIVGDQSKCYKLDIGKPIQFKITLGDTYDGINVAGVTTNGLQFIARNPQFPQAEIPSDAVVADIEQYNPLHGKWGFTFDIDTTSIS